MTHLGYPDPRLGGQQRRQRLVLDLLEPPDGARSAAGRGRRASRQRRASRWVSCASRPSTRTFSGRPVGVAARRIPPRRSAAASRPSGRAPGRRARRARPDLRAPAGRRRRCRTPAARARRHRGRAPAPARTSDGSAASSTTAPSAARATSQTASRRTGRTSSGPADRDDRGDAREPQLGEAPARQDVRLDRRTSPTRRDRREDPAVPTTHDAAPASRSRARAQRRRQQHVRRRSRARARARRRTPFARAPRPTPVPWSALGRGPRPGGVPRWRPQPPHRRGAPPPRGRSRRSSADSACPPRQP